MRKYIFLLALCFFSLPVVSAQNKQATATAIISATIVTDIIGATQFKNLNFPGLRSDQKNQELSSDLLSNAAATFTVISNGYVYSITVPTNDIFVTKKGNAHTMTVGSFNIASIIEGLNKNEQMIVIGATLIVNAYQLPGKYSSEIPPAVTINYN